MLNSTFANHRALALAARAKSVDQSLPARSRPASDRPGIAARCRLSSARREAYYRQHPAPPEAPRQASGPLHYQRIDRYRRCRWKKTRCRSPYESRSASPSQVTAHIRALADLALSLFNTNEFVYVY